MLLQNLKDAPQKRPPLWCSECAGWAKFVTPRPTVEALEFPRLRQILRTKEQGGFASLSLVAPPWELRGGLPEAEPTSFHTEISVIPSTLAGRSGPTSWASGLGGPK